MGLAHHHCRNGPFPGLDPSAVQEAQDAVAELNRLQTFFTFLFVSQKILSKFARFFRGSGLSFLRKGTGNNVKQLVFYQIY